VVRKKTRNRRAKEVEPATKDRRGSLWGGALAAALVLGGALLYFFYGYSHPGIESGQALTL
jgi:hypothetical protein